MIRTDRLTKIFGERAVVEELTLEIARGEVFGLLGPNGAGKTTTLRMLTALVAPTHGHAWVAGHRIGPESDFVRGKVGILTETPGLYPRLSAMENLRIFAELYEVSDPDARIRKWLGPLGLWDRRDDLAGSYSKGMQQKLSLARALLHEPEVVFLDEPTSALDPESARGVRAIVADLKAAGRTVVLCTHNLDEAERLCDRIGVLSRTLVAIDTPDGLRRRLYGQSVRIRLAAPPTEAVLAAARGLTSVAGVDVDGATLRVRLAEGHAFAMDNPAILRALLAAGADVVFVEEDARSLEQVYLDVLDGTRAGAENGPS